MKEFIDKLIEKIVNTPTKCLDTYSISCPDIITGVKNGIEYGCASRQNEIIDIVNELAEEYKDKVMIDGQYCWQTCSATEHCKECNRLCNGSIDYYENYDFMAEEYNKDCCEWKQYDENDIYYTGCEQIHMFIDGSPTDNKYEYCPYCGKKIKVAPYTEGE